MKNIETKQLTRKDWLYGALELLITAGVGGIKIVPLAEQLGVTSGSFYWHFKNRRELYDSLLDHWEREMTDVAIEEAKRFKGPPEDRIWHLMGQVMDSRMAGYDLAIWHWAQSDEKADIVFRRTLNKRFTFAKRMFKEAGFNKTQAEARGRMIVVYMMGESTLIPDEPSKRQELLKKQYEILTKS